MKLSMKNDIKPFTETEKNLELTSKFVGDFFLGGKHTIIGEQAGVERVWVVEELGDGEVMAKCIEAMNYIGIMDMREFSVLLETDTDKTLFAK